MIFEAIKMVKNFQNKLDNVFSEIGRLDSKQVAHLKYALLTTT